MQLKVGDASKAPNNTQSKSRLLPLPPLDIQAKWNAPHRATPAWLCVIVPAALPILYPSSSAAKADRSVVLTKWMIKKAAESTSATATRGSSPISKPLEITIWLEASEPRKPLRLFCSFHPIFVPSGFILFCFRSYLLSLFLSVYFSFLFGLLKPMTPRDE